MLTLTACGGGSDSDSESLDRGDAEEVAMAFVEAYIAGDCDELEETIPDGSTFPCEDSNDEEYDGLETDRLNNDDYDADVDEEDGDAEISIPLVDSDGDTQTVFDVSLELDEESGDWGVTSIYVL